MKITLLIGSLSSGGTERVVANLANYLAQKKHDVAIVLTSNEQSYAVDKRVRCVRLTQEGDQRFPHALVNMLRLFRMNRYLRKERVDVYVTFLPKLTSIILSQRCFLKAPVILAERCDPKTYCEASKKNHVLVHKYYPLAAGYVFQTEGAKTYYQSVGIDVTPSIVIPNAINPAFAGHTYTGERSKRIVSAGRLVPQKNFAMLIEAFAELNKTTPGYQLVIYGEGPLREVLQGKIEALGLCERISLPGRTDKIIEAIEDAVLFVLPSDYEGMPNALAEAMALGLPCVATDCPAGGSRFLIQEGENGLLVPVGDHLALAKAMEQVLTQPEYAQKLASNAKKIADELTAERTYGSWERFIEKVVNEKVANEAKK